MRILLFALIVVSTIQAQTNRYVSSDGDDGNSGSSIALAWRTVQHAMDNASPNTAVHILSGTYTEKVYVNVSGSVGSPITFQNYQDDEVIISGAGLTGDDAVLAIYDQSYIIIKGLRIRDNEQIDAQGIIVEGNCQGIEIRNNEISGINFSSNPTASVNENTNSQPLIVYGSDGSNAISDLVIDGNIVRDSRTGFSEGLAVNGNVDGFSVTNNTVYNISNIGIDIIGHEETASANDQARNGVVSNNTVYNCVSPYATAAGIYVDGGKDLVIEQNLVYQNQWGIEIGCENLGKTTSGIVVKNNFIHSNADAGIVIGGFDYPTGSGKVVDCIIRNNSCYDNDKSDGSIGGVSGGLTISYTENCIIENNVFYGVIEDHLLLYHEDVNSLNLTLDYNCYYVNGDYELESGDVVYFDFATYQAATGLDLNSVFIDPDFYSLAPINLHLADSSPLIGAANPSTLVPTAETDYDGDERLVEILDIGADEYTCLTSQGPDSDNDSVPDLCDICDEGDDTIDTDLDGIPDHCDIVLVSLAVFLEAAHIPETALMRTDLQQNGLLPNIQPYSNAPYNHSKAEENLAFNTTVVDWVLVEARTGNPATGSQVIVEAHAGLLLADGTIVHYSGSGALEFRLLSSSTSYYFSVRHRNHLDVLSAVAVPILNNTSSFDFRAMAAFGNEQLTSITTNAGTSQAMYAGDYNQDQVIQTTDYDEWRNDPSISEGYELTDGNLDGTVQTTDFDAWDKNKAKLGVEVFD
ncbi:right-handed parallel beta-helix repeat-containing protein [Chitinophagales bacterium]|nr:right-handed parallel beta-helix repeat-containing protein [Chitinophagales bacterium]